jgi:hypothetical protein
MPKFVYDKAVKAAFIQAVSAARAAGKSWAEAHKDAQAAGYTGSLGGIERMYRDLLEKGLKPRRKPGRPKGSKNKRVRRRADRFYDEATRNAIISAALAARKAGQKWPQALEAAKAKGYRGGVISLIGFVKRGPKASRKPGRPKKAAAVSGFEPLQEMIERIVKQRVKAALDRAIEQLESLLG